MKTPDDLNSQQQSAVSAAEGPIMIIAGPGTGKTKTLTARIVHLVRQGVDPSVILALTFTNKAAREMNERVAAQLDGVLPHITTFHALCLELLRAHRTQKIAFISEAERLMLLREVKKVGALKELTVRELGLRVSRAKNSTGGTLDEDVQQAVRQYDRLLSERGLFDFDDLLLRCRDLLQASANNLPYQHILVDEFQDTNDLQYDLLGLLRANDNLFVIGDPLQSIYGFRGASATVFERFKADFPQAVQVNLQINYRSVPEVVAVANTIFSDEPQLRAHSRAAGTVRAVQVLNEYAEAQWVLGTIEAAVGGSDFLRSHRYSAETAHCSFGDFAVLYRTHAAARILQRDLAAQGIPYQVAGEDSPFQQPTAIAILGVMSHLLQDEPLPVVKGFSAVQLAAVVKPLSMQSFADVPQIVTAVAAALGLETDPNRLLLLQLKNTAVRFTDPQDFLRHMREIGEQHYYDPAAQAVTLLSIHASKGLEFRHVFLLAAEEGILPHARGGQVADEAEERRLFYVAITRAKEHLDMLHTTQRGGQPAKLSRFVAELSEVVCPHEADPEMDIQRRQRQKRQQKRAQTTLF